MTREIPHDELSGGENPETDETDPGSDSPLERLELPRTLGHIVLVGVWAINDFAYHYERLVAVALAVCVIWEMLRRIWPAFSELPLIRYTLRKHERKRGLTPATFFLIGLLICIKYFEPGTVRTAIWVAAFADPTARIVGKTWGRYRIWRFRKTFEGALACMLITMVVVVASLYFFKSSDGISLGTALVAGFVAGVFVSAAEVLLPSILPALMDDNFWVLIICSTAIYLVLQVNQFIVLG